VGERKPVTRRRNKPQRSFLRAYLGKAYADADNWVHATNEWARARELDSTDPTAPLYAALELNRRNRINEAIASLEESLALNDNRRVYRSRLLLDEDRAVRSASLASIYRRAGMEDVAVREAVRAISDDYANYSAHQFLAESFDALRDPSRPWSVEYLLATLLAPVGAGPLSQHVTAQEYSRLFTQDRVGLTTDTLARSDGRVRELASQFGKLRSTDWALDLEYQHDDGTRRNNDLSRLEWFTRVKQQVTPDDTLLLFTKYHDYESGDVRQVEPRAAHLALRVEESQMPLALAAWRHEWGPGIHTLFLGGRLEDELRVSDTNLSRLLVYQNAPGVVPLPFALRYRGEFEIYTAELNQIAQTERTLTIVGARYQTGDFTTRDSLSFSNAFFERIAAGSRQSEDFERVSAYAYETIEIIRDLRLTAGSSYDRIVAPRNHRDSPIAGGTTTTERLGPKVALVWMPLPPVTLRAVYAQSLGGVSFDQSFRLEPGQLAACATVTPPWTSHALCRLQNRANMDRGMVWPDVIPLRFP